MDSTTLFIVIGASLVFVGVLAWKVQWFLKYLNADNPEKKSKKK